MQAFYSKSLANLPFLVNFMIELLKSKNKFKNISWCHTTVCHQIMAIFQQLDYIGAVSPSVIIFLTNW